MKKLCFVVSSPATARAFLKGPMQILAKKYALYLIANTQDIAALKKELPIKAVHFQAIERGVNPIKDLWCLISMWRFLRREKFDALHSVSPKGRLNGNAGRLSSKSPLAHPYFYRSSLGK